MDRKKVNQGWDLFMQMALQLPKSKKADAFYDFILTADEKQAISGRCLIVKALLEDEMTQREMADEFKMSISKITRGSNGLKEVDKNLKDFLKKQLCKK